MVHISKITQQVWRQAAMLIMFQNYYDGSTAEWIVERTEIGNPLPNLADFNSVTFTNCNTNSSVYGAHPLGWYTNYEVEMTSDGSSSGTPLANASSLTTSEQFTY